MKLLYVQIFAAAAAILFVTTAIGLMSVSAAKKDLVRRLEKAEADLRDARTAAGERAAPGAPKRGVPGQDLEKENAEIGVKMRLLESKVATLERENEMLKEALKKATAGAPAEKPVPGSAFGTGAPPPEIIVGGRKRDPAAPPPPPEPGTEPWGASDTNELDEMAAVLKLNPEQREEVRRIIMDGQNEFERLLNEASQSGERDITVIERIGEQVSKKTQARIDQILYAEQKAKFAELMRQKSDVK